jgi:hypothetical protein
MWLLCPWCQTLFYVVIATLLGCVMHKMSGQDFSWSGCYHIVQPEGHGNWPRQNTCMYISTRWWGQRCVTSFVLGPNTPVSTLFLNILRYMLFLQGREIIGFHNNKEFIMQVNQTDFNQLNFARMSCHWMSSDLSKFNLWPSKISTWHFVTNNRKICSICFNPFYTE